MSDDATVIQLTESELATGTIKSVSLPGDGGTTRIVQVRIPPGATDGTLLRVPAPGGDVHIRISATPAAATPPPTSTFTTSSFGTSSFATSTPSGTPTYRPYRPPARSRRRVVLLTGVAAAVVVVVVALITANTGGGSTGSTGQAGQQAAAPPAPTTTTTPPESAAAYQQALNGLATALTNGLAELNNAQTPQAISTAATDFGNAVQQAEGALGGIPPVAAQATNKALMSALQALTSSDLGSVGEAASNSDVCLGPAATALLSRSDSLTQLRTAVAGLASGGYQFGVTLPPVTQDGTRSANTGTIVAGGVHHGLGELTISNGGTTDATVGLVAGSGAPVVTVYVGQGGTYTLHHIADGTYTIYVTDGADWDSGARLFSRNCQFQQFDQTMDFTTTSSEYTTYSITLTPVADGNATESDVDPGSFPH